MIKEIEQKICEIEAEIAHLSKSRDSDLTNLRLEQLHNNIIELQGSYTKFSAQDKLYLARHGQRPTTKDYINHLFTDFFTCRGDHFFGEDESIIGGIARFRGVPVTVIGHQKGRTLDENIKYRYGMPNPEGYRKSLRLMEQAEKFKRPIITFIDTPGAYPGIEAEQRGQSEAIAKNLARMSSLEVPVISIVTGEGGSGGALALGVGNQVFMLEHSIYSILSPEGFATILWKDGTRSAEASEIMKITAQDLLKFGVIDGIVPEPTGGAHRDITTVMEAVDQVIMEGLSKYENVAPQQIVQERFAKFRKIGQV